MKKPSARSLRIKEPMSRKNDSFFRLSVRPWRLFTIAGILGCSVTVFASLGRFSWFLDIFSHFRVQYFWGLLILGLLLLIPKQRKMAAVFIAFAFINLSIVLPIYFGGQTANPENAHTMRVMLLNVNSRLGDPERVKDVIQEFDPDIVVLEEITSRWVNDLQWITATYPHSCVHPREDNFGIALYSKLTIEKRDVIYIGNANVPSIKAILNTGQQSFEVIATHPPPPGGADYSRLRNDQLDKIQEHIPTNSPVLLLGDLNTAPWNFYFKKLLKSTGLINSSKGRGIQTTWPNFNPLLSIPLDHCLHSSDILISRKQIGPDVGSDHYPVIVDFTIIPKH